MGLKDFLNNLFAKKREAVVMPLDPELVKENEIIKAQQQIIGSQQAKLGELLAEKNEERRQVDKKEKEKILIKELKQQEKQIKKNEVEKSVSFIRFLNDLADRKKLKGKIEVTDKEGNEIIGILGDIASIKGEFIALMDIYGNELVRGRQLDQVIYKPESLANYIRRKQIPIPYIKDREGMMHPFRDLEDIDHPDVIWNEVDKVYETTTEKTDKVKYLLISKDKDIRYLKNEIARLENIISDLKIEKDDATREAKVRKNQSDNTQSRLSQVMSEFMNVQTMIGNMQRENQVLLETKISYEVIIERLEKINEILNMKVQQLGVKGDMELVLGEVMKLIEWAKNNTPEVVTNYIQPEKQPEQVVQPQQKLGTTGGGV